ncbi:MAG: hypothetical protein WD894_24070 [Pirellulales bacterium]
MTIEKVREVYRAEPFRRFVLHLADGRHIAVPHREFMAIGPTGRTVIVYDEDDAHNIIDLLLVTDIRVENGSKRRKR